MAVGQRDAAFMYASKQLVLNIKQSNKSIAFCMLEDGLSWTEI